LSSDIWSLTDALLWISTTPSHHDGTPHHDGTSRQDSIDSPRPYHSWEGWKELMHLSLLLRCVTPPTAVHLLSTLVPESPHDHGRSLSYSGSTQLPSSDQRYSISRHNGTSHPDGMSHHNWTSHKTSANLSLSYYLVLPSSMSSVYGRHTTSFVTFSILAYGTAFMFLD
jgi:hypothetical protein